MNDLTRFIKAQDSQYGSYSQALEEMKSGGKRSHWIWYIFPQIAGLGRSEMARHYAIKDLDEAKEFLYHPVLGVRLREITSVVLSYSENADPNDFMMSHIDAMKLKSSMTLFNIISPDDIFGQVLDKFFDGKKDYRTLRVVDK